MKPNCHCLRGRWRKTLTGLIRIDINHRGAPANRNYPKTPCKFNPIWIVLMCVIKGNAWIFSRVAVRAQAGNINPGSKAGRITMTQQVYNTQHGKGEHKKRQDSRFTDKSQSKTKETWTKVRQLTRSALRGGVCDNYLVNLWVSFNSETNKCYLSSPLWRIFHLITDWVTYKYIFTYSDAKEMDMVNIMRLKFWHARKCSRYLPEWLREKGQQ